MSLQCFYTNDIMTLGCLYISCLSSFYIIALKWSQCCIDKKKKTYCYIPALPRIHEVSPLHSPSVEKIHLASRDPARKSERTYNASLDTITIAHIGKALRLDNTFHTRATAMFPLTQLCGVMIAACVLKWREITV